jgi:putative ABC transport system permease protein
MGVITRGVKNAFRNNIRTFSIVVILSISIAMALIMFMSLKTVNAKIESVKGNIGNFLTVSPAGIRGFEGGGELLTSDDTAKISQINGVSKVVSTLMDHLSSTNTNLTPATDAGSFGQRQRREESGNITTQGAADAPSHGFQMPVMVSATSDLSMVSSLNINQLNTTSGQLFDSASSDNIAVLGSALAIKNNLTVGSTFQAYSKDIKVVGIFDGGNQFANTLAIMPITTLQNLSGQTGQINSAIVQVSSIDQISSVETQIKSQLGTKADVTSNQDTSNKALEPLQNIRSISIYSLIGSVIAGGIILFLAMIMIVRERRREIGVLKAIGSSNAGIVNQFVIEAMVLTFLSSIVGIVAGALLSNPVLKILVSNNTSSTQTGGDPASHGAMMRMGASAINGAQGAIKGLTATVGIDIILYGVLAAIVIAIIGSAIPAFIIAKVRPAEVLRSE